MGASINPEESLLHLIVLTGHVHPERRGDWDALVVVDGLARVDGVEVIGLDGGDPEGVGRLAVDHLVAVVDQGVLTPPRESGRWRT